MPVIFDLKKIENTWAQSVNAALESDWPEYLETNGAPGSVLWWKNFESGNIACEKKKGIVTFIGERIDNFDEVYDCIELDLGDDVLEFDRCAYWAHEAIIVGAIVVLESFEICVAQKYGSTRFVFERLVEVSPNRNLNI